MPMLIHDELTEEQNYCLNNCFTYKEYAELRKHFENGTCPYCDIAPDTKLIHENDSWIVFDNTSSSTVCDVRLVLAPRRHICDDIDISKQESEGYREMKSWVASKRWLVGGIIFSRFGDVRLNMGTIPHYHLNLLVPDGINELRLPVYRGRTQSDKDRINVFAEKFDLMEFRC